MLKTEKVKYGDRTLIKTYSDTGKKIRQDKTGAVYEIAIDPEDAGRTYTETDEYIETRASGIVSDMAAMKKTQDEQGKQIELNADAIQDMIVSLYSDSETNE